MAHSFLRTLLALATQTCLLLTILTMVPQNQVSAQFGLSVPCNNCLVSQISTLPSCVGVNLTDPAQQSTPQYRTCLCDSSFDFNWTKSCGTSCQTNELQNFESNYPNLLKTGLNLTCVKPTPTASPTPTPTNSAMRQMCDMKAMLGWTVVVSAVLALLSTL
ncbi:hypothetical protein BC939DRAFT_297659 [Gamsiella multidivaricata]|uniref:uncharacterized protein n=1 Tax=Gamsiella multidivaricata TaxID=101098 RepID=UPI0022202964|nr:uncharacterized protein BC939DRAFT_297659 [Gamsiella multidivaricata]KAI7818306.1 hypothetical protein BC939DRAFT_297659 [Gamsiella multidivaricata]